MSPELFNVFTGVFKEEIKEQIGGLTVKRKKVRAITYANNIVLLAKTKNLKRMKQLRNTLRENGLELTLNLLGTAEFCARLFLSTAEFNAN